MDESTPLDPRKLAEVARPWLRSEDERAAFDGEHVPPMGAALVLYNRILGRSETETLHIYHSGSRIYDGPDRPTILVDRGWEIWDGEAFWQEWSGCGETPDEAMAQLLMKALPRVCPLCESVSEEGYQQEHSPDCPRRHAVQAVAG